MTFYPLKDTSILMRYRMLLRIFMTSVQPH